MNKELSKPGPQKSRKLCLIAIGISLGCVLIYIAIFRPQYVEVPIDLPGEQGWFYEDHSIRTWTYGQKYFIWRYETQVHEPPANLAAIIDRKLMLKGWIRITSNRSLPCNAVMPESYFLEFGKTMFAYQREDTDPTLCLAVWPIESYGTVHVVIMTAKRSLLEEHDS